MDLGLNGKKALVTGGSHGIGLAIAQGLFDEGCEVAICSRNPSIPYSSIPYSFMKIQVDVLKPETIVAAMHTINKLWGGVDILVNNVGGGGRWGTSFECTDEQVWIDVYNKNAMAAIRFTKLALLNMLMKGWGRVVTVASIYGKEGGGKPWFNMAKSAEISLMKSLALDYPKKGVTFNTVAPGFIRINKEERDFTSPLIGEPEDVAPAVVFLCSKQAEFINGACLVVDGGESRSF